MSEPIARPGDGGEPSPVRTDGVDALTAPATVEGWLSRVARRWPDRPALTGVDDEGFLTFEELHSFVREQAERLRSWGVGPGDIVLMALPDGPMAVAAFLAITSVATVMPVAVHERAEEYARILDEVPVSAVLMDERPQAPLTKLADERGLTLLRALPRRDAPGMFLLSATRSRSPRETRPTRLDDHALYSLTSGTTSVPKIVAISHASLWRSLEGSRIWFGLSERDRSLCLMPIAHLHSGIRCSLPVLASGGAVVSAPGFDAGQVPGWLDRFAPTFMSAAPAVHRKFLSACEAAGWQPRSESFRVFAASSDKLDQPTIEGLQGRFGARVVQLFGLSETAPHIAATPFDGSILPAGSTGRVNPAWEVVCLGEDGQPVAPGEVGEIAVRGGIVNPLVGRNVADVQRFDPEGRFLTGDLGRLDADGALSIEGRIDDVINRGGQKIDPAAVEAAIASMPAVRGVAAFATPDAVLGSRVAVLVELHDGAEVTVDTLLEHAGRSLRSFMVPELVSITDAIPRNHLGKVSRQDLAAAHRRTFGPPAAAAPSEQTEAPPDKLVGAVLDAYAHVLGRRVDDPDASFFDLGADSLHTLYLHLELEQRFGVNVQPATFARVSSASALAAHLARQNGGAAAVQVDEYQPGGADETLVFAHAIDGTSWMAFTVGRVGLAPGRQVLGLSAAGPEVLDGAPRGLVDLAPEYAERVREASPGPYVVAGHSLGAHVAAATSNALVAQGGSVLLLAVVDDDAELTRRSFGVARGRPAARTFEAFYRHAADLSPAAPFPGRMVLIRCEEDDAEYRSDRTAGWGEIGIGGIRDIVLPGNHNAIVREDDLPVLVRALLDEVDRARLEPVANDLTIDPLRALRYEARVARVRGDLSAEIGRYRDAIEIDREQPSWAYENLAVALFRAGDEAAASRALDEALARDPWPLSIELRFAPTWAEQDDDQGRLARALERSASLASDHPSVLRQRGLLAAYAGLADDAEELFRQGLEMAPDHHALHVELGAHLRREQRYDEAAWVIAELNEINPGLGWLIVLEARLYLEAGKPATAIAVLDRAARLVDVAPEGHLTRGLVLLALDRHEEALASFGEASAIEPGAPEPPRHARLVLERLGRHDEARAWADRAAVHAQA